MRDYFREIFPYDLSILSRFSSSKIPPFCPHFKMSFAFRSVDRAAVRRIGAWETIVRRFVRAFVFADGVITSTGSGDSFWIRKYLRIFQTVVNLLARRVHVVLA